MTAFHVEGRSWAQPAEVASAANHSRRDVHRAVLAPDDRTYRGVQIPLRFWKVVAWSSPAGLQSAAFVLDQTDVVRFEDSAMITAPLGAFRTFQVPVREVESVSGVALGVLVGADTVTPSLRRATWRELATGDDVVL